MTAKQLDGRYAPDGSTYSTITDGDGNLSTEPVLITGGLKQRFGNRAPDGSRYRVLTDGAGTIFAGGGGGGSYVAKAVTFADQTVQILLSSYEGADSYVMAFSLWFLIPDSNNNFLLWDSSPENFGVTYPNAGTNNGTVGLITNTLDFTSSFGVDSTTNLFTAGTWVNFLGSMDTNHPAGEKIAIMYLNDVLAPLDPARTSDLNDAFIMPFNGQGFAVPDSIEDAAGLVGSMADCQIWFNQYIDWGDINNRRKVIDANGKPADPSIATTAFGQQTFLFSGDHTTFPINQGTGGTFTLTGTLTNASTSPSD